MSRESPTPSAAPVHRGDDSLTAVQHAIASCEQCHEICLQMAMTHCIELGGAHAQPEHLRLMLGCAEICQTTANFMLARSPVQTAVCTACAEVCDACARSCEPLAGMEACVKACRRCADNCRVMLN